MNAPPKIAELPLRQVPDVRSLLINEQAKQQLAAVAAQHMRPERLMRVVANAIRSTPKLQEAEPLSFLGALMQCAALGLEPNTVLGHAFLVPFKNNRKGITEVQVIIGYKGLIDLARRSGHITSISANVHYSDDPLWEYEEGTDARLRHRPGDQNGKKQHAYAIAQFRDGGHAYVVLPWAQVMKIRDGSENWKTAVKFNSTAKSPWFTHEDAMAKKTAIRALAKYLPLSVEFMDAVQVDNDAGSRVDYAGFALHPQNGPEIEGDYIEGEAEESQPEAETKPEPKAKAAAKPAPDPKPDVIEEDDDLAQDAAHIEGKAEPEKADDTPAPERQGNTPDMERFQHLTDSILRDIGDVAPDGVADVLDLYEAQIGQLESVAPDLHAMVMKAAAEKKGGA